MDEIRQQRMTGERALFHAENLKIYDSIFDDGESPLKECSNISLYQTMFKWKYPLWYAQNVTAQDCTWFEMARAGVWYSKNVAVKGAVIEAPKNFRRCEGLLLDHVTFSNAQETLWHCGDVRMNRVVARGDYFAMGSRKMVIDDLDLVGNYSFDGCENVEIDHSRLLSKDAFWNSDHITVRNSFISGEYLGWNSRHLTLIDCTIESLQGMCYIDHLVMKRCKLINTTLAFEYSSVEADIDSHIDSVLNPTSGAIRASSIGELILQKDYIDPDKTQIIVR